MILRAFCFRAIKVTLSPQHRGTKVSQETDARGLAVFGSLPVDGACSLRAESPGFETTLATDVPCRPECETTVDLLMHVDMRKLQTVT